MKSLPKITEKDYLDSKDQGWNRSIVEFCVELEGFFYLREMKDLDIK